MLAITRKENESLLLGENIKITILSIKGNSVKIGIEAPKEINITRTDAPNIQNFS